MIGGKNITLVGMDVMAVAHFITNEETAKQEQRP